MNKIKELCLCKQISQKQLAALMGVTQPTISDWWSNKTQPKGERLTKLSEILQEPISVFMGFSDPKENAVENLGKTKEPISEDRLKEENVIMLSQLTPSEVQRVLDFVAGLKAARADGDSRQE